NQDDLVLNKYKVIREIGRGGMNSVIYLAEDITIKENEYFALQNKYVAIKVVNWNPSINEAS
ncbi:MAG: hypothetical protein K2M43_03035, partial [Mycoplasmoidaceae bacterium]|nr:hypothetical protein [Mycoplasmoidaceae bacterium]